MVSIGQAVRQALPVMQRQAESMMWDQLRVVARDGTVNPPSPGSFDVDPHEDTVYVGKGRVKPLARVTGNDVDAGQAADERARLTVSVPITVTSVRPGHVVVVVSCPTDPSLNGDELVVMDVEQGDQLTARRMTCYVDRRRT